MAILVTCPDCDRRLKAPPTSIGKKIRCPACETVFVCQADEEVPVEVKPSRQHEPERGDPEDSADSADSADSRSDDQEESPPVRRRPKRRPIKKRSSAGMWVGLAVLIGLVVLAAVGGGAFLLVMLLRNPSIPDGDWVQFTTPDGACSVLMPGTPVLDNTALKSAPGNKYILVRKQEDVFFAVAYVDLPTRGVGPGLLKLASDGERDALQQKVGGTVTFDQDVNVLGYTGREFQLRAAFPHRGVLMERIFMVPSGLTTRLYIVGTGGSIIEPGTGAAAKFLDSLAIKAPLAAPLPLLVNPPPILQPPVLTNPKPKK